MIKNTEMDLKYYRKGMSGEETVQVVDGEESRDRSEFEMCMYLM